MTQPRQPTKHERRKTNIVTGKPKATTALLMAVVIALALPATIPHAGANPVQATVDEGVAYVVSPKAQGQIVAYPLPTCGESTDQGVHSEAAVTSVGESTWRIDYKVTYTTNWGEPGTIEGKTNEKTVNSGEVGLLATNVFCGPWKQCTFEVKLKWHNGLGFEDKDADETNCALEQNVE